jgi:hypothetical protein
VDLVGEPLARRDAALCDLDRRHGCPRLGPHFGDRQPQ